MSWYKFVIPSMDSWLYIELIFTLITDWMGKCALNRKLGITRVIGKQNSRRGWKKDSEPNYVCKWSQ